MPAVPVVDPPAPVAEPPAAPVVEEPAPAPLICPVQLAANRATASGAAFASPVGSLLPVTWV